MLAGWDGIIGLSGVRNTVDIFGGDALVPASDYDDIGLFVFEQRGSVDEPWQRNAVVRVTWSF